MLKIATVLATTFLFATLLIAYPYSPDQPSARTARAPEDSTKVAAAGTPAQPSAAPNGALRAENDAGRRFVHEPTPATQVTPGERVRIARTDQGDPETFPVDRITDAPEKGSRSTESRNEVPRRDIMERRSGSQNETPTRRRTRLTRDDVDGYDAAPAGRSRSRSHAERRSEARSPASVGEPSEFGRRPVVRTDGTDPSRAGKSARWLDLVDEEFPSHRHHHRARRS